MMQPTTCWVQAALQKLPQLSLVSMAQLLTAAQRAGLASPLVLRRVTRQALALRPWDNPRHLLYLLGGLQRLEQELGQAPDVQLWTGGLHYNVPATVCAFVGRQLKGFCDRMLYADSYSCGTCRPCFKKCSWRFTTPEAIRVLRSAALGSTMYNSCCRCCCCVWAYARAQVCIIPVKPHVHALGMLP
jgi:hypothetical protein